jgi:hypothetical protein
MRTHTEEGTWGTITFQGNVEEKMRRHKTGPRSGRRTRRQNLSETRGQMAICACLVQRRPQRPDSVASKRGKSLKVKNKCLGHWGQKLAAVKGVVE